MMLSIIDFVSEFGNVNLDLVMGPAKQIRHEENEAFDVRGYAHQRELADLFETLVLGPCSERDLAQLVSCRNRMGEECHKKERKEKEKKRE